MRACICVYIYIYTRVHVHKRIYTHIYMYIFLICLFIYTYTHTYICIHIQTYKHKHMYDACMHACIHTYMYMHMYIDIIHPSSCLIKPPIFKEFFLPGFPPEDYFPLRWISYGPNPPHLKNFCLGGLSNFETLPFGKLFSSAGTFGFLLFFNRETIRGHGPTIAEPCLPYCGGGGGPPN